MTVWQPPVPVIEFIDMLGKGFMLACAAFFLGAACMLAAHTMERDDG